MATISAIGIKKLYYATSPSAALTAASLKALVAAATEITNVHGTTWSYEEAEASVTNYKNQLTGQTYRQDVEPGDSQISFTIGQYDYATKAALQGGTGNATSWTKETAGIINKCIIGLTKDDVYIVFPKAAIIGRGTSTDNAIGIAVAATALETGVTGLYSEVWMDKSAVDAAS